MKYFEAMKVVAPKDYCHKCGKNWWQATIEPFCWSCFYCGNLVYFTYGEYRQQIDIVCTSSRGWEFVKSATGKGMIPVKDEQLKEIRFQQEAKEKRKRSKGRIKPTGDQDGYGNWDGRGSGIGNGAANTGKRRTDGITEPSRIPGALHGLGDS